MRSKTLAFALALSAIAPASPAIASLSDFRLPTERPEQQQQQPDLQGPVAPDVPASRRRPAEPTPTPVATRGEPPAAEPAAAPIEVPTGLLATPAATPARPAAAPAPATTSAVAQAESQVPGQSATPPAGPAPPVATASPAGPVAGPGAPRARQGGWSWLWLLGAVPLLLAALVVAMRAARRWVDRPAGRVTAPQIERPRLKPAAHPANPLQVSLEPLRLALTLVNATLAYRLEVANRGTAALTGVVIGADMISAHASLSREEQLSGPGDDSGGAPTQRIDRLEPGESQVVEGEFRLPFPQIVPIRQGDAALLLPLARFRVDAEGAAPIVRTFVIGQPGQGKGLQPFRLDQGPRIYPRLTQHAFA